MEIEKYLTFEVADGMYALPICAVREIISDAADITPMPGAPECAKGILHIRGDVVPVVDLRCRFGAPAGNTDCVIVTDCDMEEAEYLGLAADRVCSVEDFDPQQIKIPPRFLRGASFISGVYKLGDRLVLIISPERLVTDSLRSALNTDDRTEDNG